MQTIFQSIFEEVQVSISQFFPWPVASECGCQEGKVRSICSDLCFMRHFGICIQLIGTDTRILDLCEWWTCVVYEFLLYCRRLV